MLGLVGAPRARGVALPRRRLDHDRATEFADNVTRTLVASAILPLVMLLFATSAFGNELVDRTLGYLVLKPIARWRIVAAKLAAPLVVGGVPVALSGFARGGRRRRRRHEGGAPRRGSASSPARPRTPRSSPGPASRRARALLGLVYVFVWEATLAAYLDGIRFLSIRRYTLSLIHALDGARLATLDNPLSAAGALVGTAVVLAAFTALTVRKLTRMDVP